jgi:hypothetical protein
MEKIKRFGNVIFERREENATVTGREKRTGNEKITYSLKNESTP